MKLSFVCPQMTYRILPYFKTLTQSISYWEFYVLSVFHSGTSTRPWISWCCPCPAISWAGWTQMQLVMMALGFWMQQGGHKGHKWVWKESSSPSVLATRYSKYPKCFCPLLSHLAGEVCFQSGTISSSSLWQQNSICLQFWEALSQACLINMCFAFLQ